MKIMVLNDGETFSDISGCQIVEVKGNLSTDEIESCLEILNRHYDDTPRAKILGGFDSKGNFRPGDPRDDTKKKIVKLE